jgi:hypothetical protein
MLHIEGAGPAFQMEPGELALTPGTRCGSWSAHAPFQRSGAGFHGVFRRPLSVRNAINTLHSLNPAVASENNPPDAPPICQNHVCCHKTTLVALM